jgi:phosphoribosylamine--glycine ligase
MIEICEAIIDERLNKIKIRTDEDATVVKCLAPKGYPDRRDLARGHPVSIDLNAIKRRGCRLYFASIGLQPDGTMVSGGSRLVEIFAKAETIPEASVKAESAVPYVKLSDGWGLFHRSDIGSEALLKRRIEQAELVRAVYRYRARRGLIGKTIEWIPGKGKIVLAA